MAHLTSTRCLIACAFMIALCGCTPGIRQNRDAMILDYPLPPVTSACAACPQHAPPPQVVEYSKTQLAANATETLTLNAAIQIALANSPIARVSNDGVVEASSDTFYDIQASSAKVEEELSVFDPIFRSEVKGGNQNSPPDAFFGPGLAVPLKRDEVGYEFGVERKWVTGGKAGVAYNPDPGYLFIEDSSGSSFNPRHVSELEFSLEQPLLKDAGIPINVAPIKISQIQRDQSAWDFKKTLLSSVSSIVESYWELYAAQQELNATKEVLPLLEEVVRLQKSAFDAKWVIAADVAKAEAELYRYRQEYIAAQSSVVAAELQLRDLMGLPPQDGTNINLVTPPVTNRLEVIPSMILDDAISNNPDLARQRLEFALRKLDLFIAQNELKPTFDINALYRMNGVADQLGDAIDQMSTAEFADWEVGAVLSIPLGRRRASAKVFGAEQNFVEDQQLLQQETLTVSHQLSDELRQMEFAFREMSEASKRLKSANEWVDGARLRYRNPNPESDSATALLEILNEYLRALRFRTDTIAEQAQLTADYNSALIRLEEVKGTLLEFFAISFPGDPCGQLHLLPQSTKPQIQEWHLPIQVPPQMNMIQPPANLGEPVLLKPSPTGKPAQQKIVLPTKDSEKSEADATHPVQPGSDSGAFDATKFPVQPVSSTVHPKRNESSVFNSLPSWPSTDEQKDARQASRDDDVESPLIDGRYR